MQTEDLEVQVRRFGWSNVVTIGIPPEVVESFVEMEKKVAGNRLKEKLPDIEILDVTAVYLPHPIRGGEIQTIVKFYSKSLDFAEKYLREQIESEFASNG